MAHPELDELLDFALPFGTQILESNGEFYPFGAVRTSQGSMSLAAAVPEGEKPPSSGVIEMLMQGFRQQASTDRIVATAVCYDVLVRRNANSEQTDAICVQLEHRDGEAVDVFLPYQKKDSGEIEYGDLFAEKSERQVFA